jgi:hypothetical protein
MYNSNVAMGLVELRKYHPDQLRYLLPRIYGLGSVANPTDGAQTSIEYGLVDAGRKAGLSDGQISSILDNYRNNNIASVNGRPPINSKYANNWYPLSPQLREKYPNGVLFTPQGFPDFAPYATQKVVIANLTGNRRQDSLLANRAAGLSRTPKGYVWHHSEDGRTMYLVPQDLHEEVRHTGGVASIGRASQ